jgi:uncharacterized protein
MKKRLVSSALFVLMVAGTAAPALADFEAGVRFYQQRDYQSALKEFRNDERAEAKYYLSQMLEKGDGIGQDRAAALALLQMAAERGLDVAQADLGLLYLEGRGVPENEQEGLKWLQKAADQGLVEAKSALEMATLR